MKVLFLFIFFFSFSFGDLQSRIIDKAKDSCYLKNSSNGLPASAYSPVITSQTLRQTYTTNNCDNWNLSPYVNIDTETYEVIADMSCTDTTSDTGETSAEILQYSLSIDCQSTCEIPRSSDGSLYNQISNVNEVDCTIQNLQTMLDNYYPNQGYVADDTQYLTCTSNVDIQGCYLKYHLWFDGNIDSNATENNTTENNATIPENNTTDNNASIPTDSNSTGDLIETNKKLDDLNDKLKDNTDKIEELGTKLDANGQLIENNGFKIDAVRNSVLDSGNFLGNKLDSLNDSLTNELKFQGDRLHNDLNDLKSLQSQANDTNNSDGFDDSGIIEAIHKNTAEINRSIEMERDKVDTTLDYLDELDSTLQNYVNLIDDLKTSTTNIKSNFQEVFNPTFQNPNSCIYNFVIMNHSTPIDICEKVSPLRPFLVFLLTFYFLALISRLHFYFIGKFYQ